MTLPSCNDAALSSENGFVTGWQGCAEIMNGLTLEFGTFDPSSLKSSHSLHCALFLEYLQNMVKLSRNSYTGGKALQKKAMLKLAWPTTNLKLDRHFPRRRSFPQILSEI